MNKEEILIKLIKNADYSPRSYTGRGYGPYSNSRCIGISTDHSVGKVLGFLIGEARSAATPDTFSINEALNAVQQAVSEHRTDSMGKGIIIYFPSFEIPVEEGDE